MLIMVGGSWGPSLIITVCCPFYLRKRKHQKKSKKDKKDKKERKDTKDTKDEPTDDEGVDPSSANSEELPK